MLALLETRMASRKIALVSGPKIATGQVALPPFRVAKTLEVQGAVYALSAFQGRLLGAVTCAARGMGMGMMSFSDG